jgi:DNA-binding NarL/FixJ family response regulator
MTVFLLNALSEPLETGVRNAVRPAFYPKNEISITRPMLTPTETKVLHGVGSGLMNKQIAFELGIAEATVKVHMTAIMRKLKVRNRTQAAVLAQSIVA